MCYFSPPAVDLGRLLQASSARRRMGALSGLGPGVHVDGEDSEIATGGFRWFWR